MAARTTKPLPIANNPNSPISGIYGYNQNMMVWKGDSMWQMVDAGISDFGLQTYAPERIPGNVGCVSHGSIAEVKGRLVWHAEQGLYSWNGAGEPVKFIVRLQRRF